MVAFTAALGCRAIAGNKASPSLEIALPIWADNGIMPFNYKVVTNICGPHPGKNPTTIAIRGTNI